MKRLFALLRMDLVDLIGITLSFLVWWKIILPHIPPIALWTFAGFMLFLFALAIPGVMPFLVNDPNAHRPTDYVEGEEDEPTYPKSTFGFFTYLQPGRVKIIERGERFMYCLSRLANHAFAGELPGSTLIARDPKFWDVKELTEADRAKGARDTDPIPVPWRRWRGIRRYRWFAYAPVSILFSIWKEWIYWTTGAVFTGFYPVQRVRAYPLDHFKIVVVRSSAEQAKPAKVIRRLNFSDHSRVAQFSFPVQIPEADTKDKIPVVILLNIIGRVVNPYLLAYETDDDWGTRLLGSVSDAVNLHTRATSVDDVLSATTTGAAAALAQSIITNTEEELKTIGLKIDKVQMMDISLKNPADVTPLGALARANVQRDADKALAEGKAEYTKKLVEAAKQNPEIAIAMAQVDATVRAAEAAGKNGGIVILGGGQQTMSPGDAAILQQLRKNQTQQGGNP